MSSTINLKPYIGKAVLVQFRASVQLCRVHGKTPNPLIGQARTESGVQEVPIQSPFLVGKLAEREGGRIVVVYDDPAERQLGGSKLEIEALPELVAFVTAVSEEKVEIASSLVTLK